MPASHLSSHQSLRAPAQHHHDQRIDEHRFEFRGKEDAERAEFTVDQCSECRTGHAA